MGAGERLGLGPLQSRRKLLQAAIAALAAGAGHLPAQALARTGTRPVIDVRSKGARGDGRRDDTPAFQSAVDALPASGGVVHVPAGNYLIDPLRSVRLRSNMHLRLAPGATLLAKPNAAERAYVLLAHRCNNIEISGGEIVGERAAHKGRGGEWGHGLMVRGSSHVVVRDLRISRCWGDGISIGAAKQGSGEGIPSTDVLISRVVCRGNRRQGLTIGRSRRVRVLDCEFSDTHGTKPEYGIDIEPDHPGRTQDVRIERCVVRGNRGGGIQLYHRVSDVTIRDCTIERNGYGVYVVTASNGSIENNRIRDNRHAGMVFRKQASNFRVRGNRVAGNSKRADLSLLAAVTGRGQIQVAEDTRNISLSGNRYD